MDQRETDFKDRWNRMRLLATITIQPHLAKGKKITAEKLLPFPWDKKPAAKDTGKQMTREEQRRRMEKMVANLGDELI